MRPIIWLAPAAAALALSACAPTVSTRLVAASGNGAPAPVAGYDWHLNEDADEASLSYGMAETDDVPLDLSCRPGSGALQILQTVAQGHPKTIALESGGDTGTYPAESEPSAMHDGLDLTAAARTTDPVFQRFRKLGWLATYGPDYRTPLAAQQGSDKQIDRFFVLCG
jgi:hypothetical protein